MDNPIPGADAAGIVTVLSISPFEEDHLTLERTLRPSEATLYPDRRVRITRRSEPSSALAVLRGARIPIVARHAEFRFLEE